MLRADICILKASVFVMDFMPIFLTFQHYIILETWFMQRVANGELKLTVHVLTGRTNLCCDLLSPMEFHRYMN